MRKNEEGYPQIQKEYVAQAYTVEAMDAGDSGGSVFTGAEQWRERLHWCRTVARINLRRLGTCMRTVNHVILVNLYYSVLSGNKKKEQC